MNVGALHGLKVLDLSRVLAGPWAGQLLGDLGADVVKVERPGPGDDTRTWGPPWVKDETGADSRQAAYFQCANRNKRSVAIDIATPVGQAQVRALAAQADVVLENFKVGGLAGYGLDYASLAADNPKLVYCSITGFGQDGALCAARRLRLPDPGHGWPDEPDRPLGRRRRRRPAEGRRGPGGCDDRPVRHHRRAGRPEPP
jgi:crotonobetainyl-CoA:carnitine CoA-transferase CaiB-like acyl-CoA transferase